MNAVTPITAAVTQDHGFIAASLNSSLPTTSRQDTKVFIKRISLKLGPPADQGHKSPMRPIPFGKMAERRDSFENRGWMFVSGSEYETTLRIHAPNPSGTGNDQWSDEFALLHYNPNDGIGESFRVERNPTRWGTHSAYLLAQLQEVMLCTNSEFEERLMEAKITRLAVAINIPGIRPDDCLWDMLNAVNRSLIVKSGTLKAIYLAQTCPADGKEDACISDRTPEMGTVGQTLTEVERVVTGDDLRLCDLLELPNVFADVQCFDVRAALAKRSMVPQEYRNFVRDSCVSHGLAYTMAKISSAWSRKAIESAIRSSVPELWKADLAWEAWPDALTQAFPCEPD